MIKINKDCSEIIPYDEAGIPIYVQEGILSDYPDYRALAHWHEDLEFIYVLDGCMDYYINGESVFLKKGDVIAVNSGRLHYGYSNAKKECYFYCIILHPSLITTNKLLSKKYISSVTQTGKKDYFLFRDDKEMTELMEAMYQLKTNPTILYELEVICLFHAVWKRIYLSACDGTDRAESHLDEEMKSQRAMVSYIYQNYGEHITLEDIAAAGNISRSKCCQIFKKYVGKSPIDFTNAYRLEVSQNLILTTDLNITDICMSCGFNHLSYFTKQFQMKYGCTPREYRKRG